MRHVKSMGLSKAFVREWCCCTYFSLLCNEEKFLRCFDMAKGIDREGGARHISQFWFILERGSRRLKSEG